MVLARRELRGQSTFSSLNREDLGACYDRVTLRSGDRPKVTFRTLSPMGSLIDAPCFESRESTQKRVKFLDRAPSAEGGVNDANVPKAQRKQSHDARSARDYRAITRCAQRSRAAPTRPRASNLLIVGTRSHEQREKQSVIIARSTGRRSQQIAARYPRGRSRPMRAPRDPCQERLCCLEQPARAVPGQDRVRVSREPQMVLLNFCNFGSRPGHRAPARTRSFAEATFLNLEIA